VETIPVQSPSPKILCGECGGSYPVQDLARFGTHLVCANCKPGYVQRMREGVQAAGVTMTGVHYGGFWIRLLATFLDSLIMSVVVVPVAAAIGLSTGIFTHFDPQDTSSIARLLGLELGLGSFGLLIGLLYQGYFVSQKGATPGKMVLGLRIVNAADGSNLSLARAIGRYFAYMLSGIVLYIGYIIAAFDSEKRALHDHICATRVIYKR
jgi:uncharacterized RDD family membrane protein YckC